ncbi:hypothetical protein O181_104160 [Austropuccinia psidii MF-1]|uniref:FAR1 domain-containing protein n=1 Tax=Austropuccinia psidii MF-1 TaxID=1389203 RepID=A0A9Q3JMY4_9BASI|nr:hypothetical protein [Austropuccinia psidii MF-1]
MESLQPIEAPNLHESGTIQFKGDIEGMKSSIQATAHCTPAFLVPKEQFPPITEPDKYDYSTGLKLEPAPLAKRNDVDTLIQFAQKWAKIHGYALRKKNSHQGKKVYLSCDQYGEYISLKGPTQRQSRTKKCVCNFRLRGSIPALIPLEILHNYPPSTTPSVHPIHCWLNEKELVQAEGLMKANVRPNQILSQIYSQGNTCTTSRTLYNYKGHLSIKERNGQYQLEYLIGLLKESNWIHSNKININGKITNLFFAHPASI